MGNGTDFVAVAAKGLASSPVYVDDTTSLTHRQEVQTQFAGGDVAVAVLPEVAATAVGPTTLAEQILAATGGKYQTVVVVIDKARDSFGVAGKGAESITTTLNAANSGAGGDGGAVLATTAKDVLAAARSATSTSTQVPGDGGGAFVPLAGGGALLAAAVIAVLALRRRGRRTRGVDASVGGSGPREREAAGDFRVTYDPQRSYTSDEVRDDVDAWYQASERRGGAERFGLRQLVSDARDILDQWEEVERGNQQYDVLRILLEYVPSTLRTYYEIPPDLRERSSAGRRAPTATVQEQMRLIGTALGEIRQAVYDGRIQELEVQSIFLRDKYERNDSQLHLS